MEQSENSVQNPHSLENDSDSDISSDWSVNTQILEFNTTDNLETLFSIVDCYREKENNPFQQTIPKLTTIQPGTVSRTSFRGFPTEVQLTQIHLSPGREKVIGILETTQKYVRSGFDIRQDSRL